MYKKVHPGLQKPVSRLKIKIEQPKSQIYWSKMGRGFREKQRTLKLNVIVEEHQCLENLNNLGFPFSLSNGLPHLPEEPNST